MGYKWEDEKRVPTDDEVGTMSGDEYDYLQKRMDAGWPNEKPSTPPPPPPPPGDKSGGVRGYFEDRRKALRETR